ncbi:uncharacterized protein LOC143883548 isoform X2 [Tasmannia lanceolata]|uniref:uncharacterized protein LOC143883548 isoform X2 n=1 Tax=Tasmannia lanceolata TaxID=3420 RepID=UPI004062DB4F
MDDSISTFCKTLASFCKHVQTSCDSLKESVERRPIPLDSASSTFIQRLNHRVSSVSEDLNLIHSMAFETVSFEELLGHCNEVYKKSQNDLTDLEDRLRSFGYVPDSKFQSLEDRLDKLPFTCRSGSLRNRIDEDPLLEDSVSLKDFGLSDVCLATLASEANDELASPKMSPQHLMRYNDRKALDKTVLDQPSKKGLGIEETANLCPISSSGIFRDDSKSFEDAAKTLIKISKDDYDKLPSLLKSLASWEDLQEATEKMNSTLIKKQKSKGDNLFNQDEITSLGLGPKGRSYLLLLIRMKQLGVETIGGSIVYRVTDSPCM